ncbi:hypothetical protein, partial [Streptomyces sp. NPDC007856]|uniref:hypothetical protein n=1 Tax=Streptomyces sp. NPDC007856 TaxID=3364781 RepID=UPI0036D1111A
PTAATIVLTDPRPTTTVNLHQVCVPAVAARPVHLAENPTAATIVLTDPRPTTTVNLHQVCVPAVAARPVDLAENPAPTPVVVADPATVPMHFVGHSIVVPTLVVGSGQPLRRQDDHIPVTGRDSGRRGGAPCGEESRRCDRHGSGRHGGPACNAHPHDLSSLLPHDLHEQIAMACLLAGTGDSNRQLVEW